MLAHKRSTMCVEQKYAGPQAINYVCRVETCWHTSDQLFV